MSWYFCYIAPLVAGQVACAICDGRPSRVRVTGPIDAVAELGSFVAPVDDQRVAQLRATVGASKYATLVGSGPVAPEMLMLSMGEGHDDELPDPFRGFLLHQRPPQIQPVVDLMDRIVGELRQHPTSVIRAEGRWTSQTVGTSDELVARIRFTNPGTEDAVLYHPVGGLADTHATTTLVVSRHVPPAQLVPDRDVKSVVLSTAELAAFDGTGQPAAAADTIEVPAGGSFEVELRKKAYLSPGQYRGVVTFRLVDGDLDVLPSVYGTLPVALGPFVVT